MTVWLALHMLGEKAASDCQVTTLNAEGDLEDGIVGVVAGKVVW